MGEGRYEIKDIKSADGGFGIVYKAIDKKLNNRNVLIKARRYDNIPGLFSYAYDKSRDDEIRDMREEISFEIKVLRHLKIVVKAGCLVKDVVYGLLSRNSWTTYRCGWCQVLLWRWRNI